MICTEEEAKKKRCPLSRVTQFSIPTGGGIRIETTKPQNYPDCIASDCMLWEEQTDVLNDPGGEGVAVVPTGRGRCGLVQQEPIYYLGPPDSLET